jgi:D-alanyl-D-alanine-carboxypeptidase/D-alanyl-D-alanine-endopeptidase
MTRACTVVTAILLFFGTTSALAADDSVITATEMKAFAAMDKVFADYMLDAHVPGMVYGLVAEGRLKHVRAYGVQDLASRRSVTPDTLFRIASMTKAFTALTVLKLRDEGRLRLDDLAEVYVPEMREWKYPTQDSPRIRVRDLLNHTAGFVTDDPWGDRQQPLTEAAFTQLLREGVPFARAPALNMEYSNLGYAILGRIISNVSGRPYADMISRTLMEPLGMSTSGFDADAAPEQRRAQGYDWHDDTWTRVSTMAHGAFGAMGGVQTNAVDYAKWVAYLLSAWPARDDADIGPVRRATVRELAQGSNFPALLAPRHVVAGQEACRRATTYGMGMFVRVDCEFGLHLDHGGGYPGYGAYVLLLPQQGVGLFVFANRTYGGPAAKAAYAAMSILKRADLLGDRPETVSVELDDVYRAVGAVYEQGEVAAAGTKLAMNFLMDRDAGGWSRDLAALRKQVGDCDTKSSITATSALSGTFNWRCARGRLNGTVLLAPTRPPAIQSLKLSLQAP